MSLRLCRAAPWQALRNLAAVLAEAGSSMDQVLQPLTVNVRVNCGDRSLQSVGWGVLTAGGDHPAHAAHGVLGQTVRL